MKSSWAIVISADRLGAQLNKLRAAIPLLCLVSGLPPTLHAQTETASISGSVTDPTGAVVPNATVRLMDVDRGRQREVASGNSGFYALPAFVPVITS
jgi:hypothetical protein